jgi:hypothetical protein
MINTQSLDIDGLDLNLDSGLDLASHLTRHLDSGLNTSTVT